VEYVKRDIQDSFPHGFDLLFGQSAARQFCIILISCEQR